LREAGREHFQNESSGLGAQGAIAFRPMCNLYSLTKGQAAIDADRPLFAFAGLWTPWRGVRGPKSAPVEGEHELFGLCQTNDRSSAHGAARPDPSGH
jgi:hypothetical protein